MRELITKVRGTTYRSPKDIGAARMLDKGDSVILRREPDNEYDPFAIQVLTRTGNVIGYVAMEDSEYLSKFFDRLIAKVESRKFYEIPRISIKVTISENPVAQPEIVTDPNQMTTSEQMMVLEDIIKTSNQTKPFVSIPEGYWSMGSLVSWTEELPRENILRAKKCQKGDPVKLVLNPHSRYENRIEIYTQDGILIGFIDEEANPGYARIIEHLSSPVISSCESFDRMSIKFLCPSEKKEFIRRPALFCDYPFKEISSAAEILKEDPAGALDILQYAIDHEKGITAKQLAMKCYWHLKDWESRRKMAIRIIDTIESIPEDELNPITYNYYHTRYVHELLKAIETCEKRLNNLHKKNKKKKVN